MTSKELQQKKVILLMIDTLMDVSIQAALEKGNVPALKFFMENGYYYPDVVCPFPTMSVNVDSTLLTGVYCDQHKVPGLVWFDKNENRIVNYGSSSKEMIKLGMKQTVMDMVYNLNNHHLSKEQPTIHESLRDKGKQTASINALLYRGSTRYSLKVPGIDKEIMTNAPDIFSYGLLAKRSLSVKNLFAIKKYGFNDRFSVNKLIDLIDHDHLPDFTLIYLPDFDQRVHKNGRTDIKGLQKVDKQLQRILNQFDSWEEALEQHIWIILGDNGQATVEKDKKKALIQLQELFEDCQIVKLRRGCTAEDDIVLGVNERMTYIYSLKPEKTSLADIVGRLKLDNRIDVIASYNGKTITVVSGIHDGELHFHPNGDYTDEYGQSWFIEGNVELLDIEVHHNKLIYKDYPDPLARLYAAFHSHDGDYVVASAKPGYEFKGEGSPTHVGGASHGGLHKQDSLVPIIICGTNSTPKYFRTLDLKEWIESLVLSTGQ